MGAAVEPWGGDVPRRGSKSQKLPKRIGCRSARLRHGPRRPRPVPEREQTRAEGRGQITERGKPSRRTRRKGKRLGLGGATGGEWCLCPRAKATREPVTAQRPRLSTALSVLFSGAQRVPACASVYRRVPACAIMSQQRPAARSSECRRFRREPVCASSPRPRITAAGLAKSQAKGQESRHSTKSRPLRAGCNKSLASPEAARAAYNMLPDLCSPLPLPPLLSSPSPPPSSPAEVA
jgi:hypothetical protein